MSTRQIRFRTLIVALALAASGALGTKVALAQSTGIKDEKELIAILSSEKPEADKALACKQLSVYGSSASVPELAKLLANERLAAWSRIALEVIPGEEADAALRTAAGSLKGRLLVGVLNSIGVRRDDDAVQLLAGRLGDSDPEVASAAAVALGRIGSSAAAQPLTSALAGAPAAVRSAVAEGCILCAEQALAAGKRDEAVKLYDQVRQADVPRQRMLEATRGAILARGSEGIPLLVEQLRANDKGLFQIALFTAREVSGSQIDKALAAELESAFPERAALIVTAMADRKETVDLAALQKAAGGGAKPVRIAAIEALGRVGNVSNVGVLLDGATGDDEDIAATAKQALADLPGPTVDQEIASRLNQAQGKTYPVLIEIVGRRRIDAVPALLKAIDHQDAAVRLAAIKALGSAGAEKELPVLINQVVAPRDSQTADAAQSALKEAAIRMPDREACAAQLAAALSRGDTGAKTALLETLAAVGGTKGLAAVASAAKSSDATMQDVASRLLGEWMTIDAAPVLLDLAKGTGRYQGRAYRGYLRIARQFTMSDAERVEMCKKALEAARQPAERKLVLEVLQRYPSVETLKLAVQASQDPALKEDGRSAAQTIAGKLRRTEEVREVLSKAGLGK